MSFSFTRHILHSFSILFPLSFSCNFPLALHLVEGKEVLGFSSKAKQSLSFNVAKLSTLIEFRPFKSSLLIQYTSHFQDYFTSNQSPEVLLFFKQEAQEEETNSWPARIEHHEQQMETEIHKWPELTAKFSLMLQQQFFGFALLDVWVLVFSVGICLSLVLFCQFLLNRHCLPYRFEHFFFPLQCRGQIQKSGSFSYLLIKGNGGRTSHIDHLEKPHLYLPLLEPLLLSKPLLAIKASAAALHELQQIYCCYFQQPLRQIDRKKDFQKWLSWPGLYPPIK